MRVSALLALVGVLGASAWVSSDDKKKPDEAKWPAYVDGKYVHKTISFKPDKIEYLPSRGRRAVTTVVFHIKDKSIPADYFPVGVFGNEKDVEEIVTKYLKERDGKITVDAYWVNLAVPKKEWTGDPAGGSRAARCFGKLVPPIDGRDESGRWGVVTKSVGGTGGLTARSRFTGRQAARATRATQAIQFCLSRRPNPRKVSS